MGEVYRAHDTRLNRDVAIKVLLPTVANDPDRLARFSREAQVLASLNHPNIAHIHGLEESGGVTALVLELVEGEDLAQRIARGPVPLDEALPIARQIAEALEAAHDHGIIHRDLKPANIKVRADGTVKVLDFGLAKALDPAAGSSATAMNSPTLSIHATEAGVILGTAAYMSPEQARGKAVDRRTDIWALGCVLFEMMTGKRAFRGDDATDTIVAVVSKEPEWSTLPSSTPVGVHRLLRRTLEKDPKRRLDSAAAVRLEIDEALAPSSSPMPVGGATAVSRSHRLWNAAIVGALLLVAAAVTLTWYPRTAERGDPTVRFRVLPPLGVVRPTQGDFSAAPDGGAVAFVARNAGGQTQIFVHHFDEAEGKPLPGTEGAVSPFWAPDSQSIGFAKQGVLYRSDVGGGPPRRLCDLPTSMLFGGTWSSRGVIVAATSTGLIRVPDTGGAAMPITTLDAAAKEGTHAGPFFLPDGQHVLFLALATGQTVGTVWATAIDDPSRTRIAESHGPAEYADGWLLTTNGPPRVLVVQPFDANRLQLSGSPQMVRDRLSNARTNGVTGFAATGAALLVVDRPAPIQNQLAWFDRTGKLLGTVGPRGTINVFALAPDERRVVAQLADEESQKRDFWLFDGDSTSATRLTHDGATKLKPIWTNNGHYVHYSERTTAGLELRRLAVGSTAPTPLPNPGGFSAFNEITRDGRYFLMQSLAVSPQSIWLQDANNPEIRRPLVSGIYSSTQPRVSPDNKWLAYTVVLPSATEVFVQPFDRPGERRQVSVKGGVGAIWRDDGRELFYEGQEALMAVSIAGEAGSLKAGPPRKLFPIRTHGMLSTQPQNFEAGAHGQRFLVNTVVGETSNASLEVTLNWTAGLKK
jgi:Tol biopolymer transport system component